jgi:hypothetical protein
MLLRLDKSDIRLNGAKCEFYTEALSVGAHSDQ